MGENSDHDAVKAGLLARLEELEAAEQATRDSRKPVELDQQSVGRLSRVDAMQVQAMAQATERRRIQERQRIHAALGRMDSGTYGTCIRCGEDIEAARLELDPTTPLCLPCARSRET